MYWCHWHQLNIGIIKGDTSLKSGNSSAILHNRLIVNENIAEDFRAHGKRPSVSTLHFSCRVLFTCRRAVRRNSSDGSETIFGRLYVWISGGYWKITQGYSEISVHYSKMANLSLNLPESWYTKAWGKGEVEPTSPSTSTCTSPSTTPGMFLLPA